MTLPFPNACSIGQLLTDTLPLPTQILRWGEDMPPDVKKALENGETALLLDEHGEPNRLILIDVFGTVRETMR